MTGFAAGDEVIGYTDNRASQAEYVVVEERNLTATFPQAYPQYKSRTKMLIPFLL